MMGQIPVTEAYFKSPITIVRNQICRSNPSDIEMNIIFDRNDYCKIEASIISLLSNSYKATLFFEIDAVNNGSKLTVSLKKSYDLLLFFGIFYGSYYAFMLFMMFSGSFHEFLKWDFFIIHIIGFHVIPPIFLLIHFSQKKRIKKFGLDVLSQLRDKC